jgi:hypothetical protein
MQIFKALWCWLAHRRYHAWYCNGGPFLCRRCGFTHLFEAEAKRRGVVGKQPVPGKMPPYIG